MNIQAEILEFKVDGEAAKNIESAAHTGDEDALTVRHLINNW
jgi:hypothetical protein